MEALTVFNLFIIKIALILYSFTVVTDSGGLRLE